MNIYSVTIKQDTEHFENLSQVYGFLCGRLTLYRKYYPTFKMFKRWWGIRRRKGQHDPHLTIQDVEIIVARTR